MKNGLNNTQLTEASVKNNDKYALGVGEKAGNRLDIMDNLINKGTHQQLIEAGISSGQTVVDLGCGNGTVTAWMADQVGPHGQVFAIDVSGEQIERAKAKVADLGITNVTFIKGDIQCMDKLPVTNADLVFSRCLLMHVPDPQSLLKTAAGLLKPGGKIACQEPITSTAYSEPEDKIFSEMNEALIKIGQHFEGDWDIGMRLHSVVRESGYEPKGLFFTQRTATAKQMKALLGKGIPECKPAALASGAASEEKLNEWEDKVNNYPEDRPFFYALPKQSHVMATKCKPK